MYEILCFFSVSISLERIKGKPPLYRKTPVPR